MTIRACYNGVLWAGLGGTVVLVLAGFWTLLSRVWAASITQVLEVGVASPFLGAWCSRRSCGLPGRRVARGRLAVTT